MKVAEPKIKGGLRMAQESTSSTVTELDKLNKTIMGDIFGDSFGVISNTDPHKTLDSGMPSFLTENILDQPIK